MLTRRQAAQVILSGPERLELYRSRTSIALESLKKAGNVKKEILKEIEDVLRANESDMIKEVAQNMEVSNQVLTWKNKFLESEKAREEAELKASSVVLGKNSINVSYADALRKNTVNINGKNGNKTVIVNPLKKVCVIDNPNGLEITEIRNKIKSTGIIEKTGVRINKIYPTKKGKVVIEVPTSIDQGKILDNLSNDEILKVREPVKRQKKYIIRGIPKYISDEEIVNDVKKRAFNASGEGKIKLIKSFVGIKKEVKNCIIAVDGDIAEKIGDVALVHIDLDRFRMVKYIPRVQCFRCAEIGHTAHSCKKQACCANCAGEHELRDCEDRQISKCANCVKSNRSKKNKNSKNLDTGHQAINKICPTWVKFLKNSKYI